MDRRNECSNASFPFPFPFPFSPRRSPSKWSTLWSCSTPYPPLSPFPSSLQRRGDRMRKSKKKTILPPPPRDRRVLLTRGQDDFFFLPLSSGGRRSKLLTVPPLFFPLPSARGETLMSKGQVIGSRDAPFFVLRAFDYIYGILLIVVVLYRFAFHFHPPSLSASR